MILLPEFYIVNSHFIQIWMLYCKKLDRNICAEVYYGCDKGIDG